MWPWAGKLTRRKCGFCSSIHGGAWGGIATNRAKANEIKVFFLVGNGDLIDDKMDTLSRFIDQFGPW